MLINMNLVLSLIFCCVVVHVQKLYMGKNNGVFANSCWREGK